MEIHEARRTAADYIEAILDTLWESTDLDTLQEAFECDVEDAMSILFELGQVNVTIEWDRDEHCKHDETEVQIGDPDPTNVYGDEYECCAATEGTWYCTRLAGHDSPHIAGDGFEVCAVWS